MNCEGKKTSVIIIMLAGIVLISSLSGCASNSSRLWSNTIHLEMTRDKNNELVVKGIGCTATSPSGESREGLATPRPKKFIQGKGLGGGVAYEGWIHHEFTGKDESTLFLNTSSVMLNLGETYALVCTPETAYQLPEEDLPDAETILWKLGKKHMYSVGGRIDEVYVSASPALRSYKKIKVIYVSWIERKK